MAGIDTVTDLASWEALWAEQAAEDAPVRLLFKHSPRCSISRAAEAAFERFAARTPGGEGVRLCRLDVVASRDVSQQIARDTGVPHESPQAILLGPRQKILWHRSHGSIYGSTGEESLAGAVRAAARGRRGGGE